MFETFDFPKGEKRWKDFGITDVYYDYLKDDVKLSDEEIFQRFEYEFGFKNAVSMTKYMKGEFDE